VRRPSLNFSPLKEQAREQFPNRIHIVGASGSGTTSLASAIATRYGHRHLDTDDFFWMSTSPPYREKRPREERLAHLRRALLESGLWVLSGSLCGWGDPLISEFELVVFLAVPTPVRLMRLRARELERYGERASTPGGELRKSHVEFIEWAGRYDTGGLEMRSRALHEAWLATLPCATVRLEGDLSVAEQLVRIEARSARSLSSSARSLSGSGRSPRPAVAPTPAPDVHSPLEETASGSSARAVSRWSPIPAAIAPTKISGAAVKVTSEVSTGPGQ
jgi:adenylate kinase family enzyme